MKHRETEGRLSLHELQASIEATFGERDRARGVDGTFRWWVEEVGEVAKALRERDPGELQHEIGDALAWLTSVANLVGVDLERAASRFVDGCPRCGKSPCTCPGARRAARPPPRPPTTNLLRLALWATRISKTHAITGRGNLTRSALRPGR